MSLKLASRILTALIFFTHALGSHAQSQADLSVMLSGPFTAVFGNQVPYSLTVANSGPGSASNVTISLLPPPSYPTTVQGSLCNGGFPCDIGTVAPGQSVQISIFVQTPYLYCPLCQDPASLSITASVSSDVPDPNPANNTAFVFTELFPVRSLAIPAPAGGLWSILSLIVMLSLAAWMNLRIQHLASEA